MGFNTNSPRNEYTAIASQTEFTFNFKIFTSEDITVYLTPSGQVADDTADILVLSTDYTVVINGDDGGVVTLISPASVGDKVTLFRSINITRDIDYQDGGDLLADTIDLDQDKQTYMIADIEASKNRFISVPSSLQGVDTKIPTPIPNAVLSWNATGTGFANNPDVGADLTIFKDNRDAVITVSDSIDNVNIVATNIGDINTVAADIAAVKKVADDLNEAISEVETVALDLQETTSEIEVVANNIDIIETNANNIVDIQNASANALLAKGYATETEDVEVEPGLYSAYHWSEKAKLNASGTASNISIVDTDGNYDATNVEDALAEVATDKQDTLVSGTNIKTVNSTSILGSGDIVIDSADTKLATDGLSIIKSNDASIKNQCTAWVNFDGTTTPPTIIDSFNVSDVVRSSTGSFKVYFETPMNNIGYSVSSIHHLGARYFVRAQPNQLDYCWVVTSSSAGDFDAIMSTTVFGGKN